MTRCVNDAGLNLIKSFEICRLMAFKPTRLPTEPWTIGWGHTGSDVYEGLKWNMDQANQAFRDDVQDKADAVDKLIEVDLTDNQFAAIVSLVYNIGAEAFAMSTLRKLINTRQFDAAADQFKRWIYEDRHELAGLVTRRAAEEKMFRS